jgi:pimeloyl-ACP methyl ester carboxylesterase
MILDYSLTRKPSPDESEHLVVLLHGYPLNRSMWLAQMHSLGTWPVCAPDLRGHGESFANDGVYTMDLLADDVMETLDELHLRRPVVLGGLSMGGYVALAAIARYPDRFRGLILMDTRAAADAPEAAANREAQARQVEATGEIDPIIDAMLPRLFAPATPQRQPQLVDEVLAMMLGTMPLGIIGALRGMAARPDRTAELPSIRVPTLVLAGADDGLITPDEMRRMAAAIPNARFEIIPDAGHLAPMENPAACNTAILDFLGTVA